MLTLSKMHAHSVEYYIATAGFEDSWQARDAAARGGGGLAEYYSEKNTRLPVALVVGDEEQVARLMGVRGGQLMSDVDVRRWLDDGVAPSGLKGRKFQEARVDPVTKERKSPAVHGYDLTFAAPKDLSVIRAIAGDDYVEKVVLEAHELGVRAAMTYGAQHVAYTRVSNPQDPSRKDLVRLPGLTAAAFTHETSRAGDMHLHTHVIVGNRQATADGRLAALDGTSLYHEAKAMGMLYQAVVRDHTHKLLGLEWRDLDPDTGMAKVAGLNRDLVRSFSKRKTQLDDWAESNRPDSLDLDAIDEAGDVAAYSKEARAARAKWSDAAQKATRPKKETDKTWDELKAGWRETEEARELFRPRAVLGRSDPRLTRDERPTVAQVVRQAGSERDQYRRADIVEAALGLWGPSTLDWDQRLAAVEELADQAVAACRQVNMHREAHEREGHVLYTDGPSIERAKEVARLSARRDDRLAMPITDSWLAQAKERRGGKLSDRQLEAIKQLAISKWNVNVVEAAAGTGKTKTLTALRERAEQLGKRVRFLTTQRSLVNEVKAAGDFPDADTIAAEMLRIEEGRHGWDRDTLVVVDEAGMVGNEQLRRIMRAAADAGAKAVLVGDSHQLQPVKTAGGLFRRLAEKLPWTLELNEVWRQKDPLERVATLALRDSADHTAINKAVAFYAERGRVHAGDADSMAEQAMRLYNQRLAEGKDTLLMSEQWKVVNSLNRKIQIQHHHMYGRTDADTSVELDKDFGQRAYIGDVIITRENNRDIPVWSADDPEDRSLRVTNADRWTVAGVWKNGDAEVVRLRDGAGARLPREYLRENALLGWSTTLHPKQGATAEVGIVLLNEATAKRWMLYPGLTRGELENQLFVIVPQEGEKDHQHRDPDQPREPLVLDAVQAGERMKAIVLSDERQRALADVAEEAVQNVLDRRDAGEALVDTGISPEVFRLVMNEWLVRLHTAERHAADLAERDERIEREQEELRERIERLQELEREQAQRRLDGRDVDDGPDMSR